MIALIWYIDFQNRVWPRRLVVHFGLFDGSSRYSLNDQFLKLLKSLNYFFSDIFYIKSVLGVLSDSEVFFLTKQISNCLIVYLKVTKLEFVELFLSDTVPEHSEGFLDNALFWVVPCHGVGFPWASLAIGKNTSIVALEDITDDLVTDLLKNLLLAGLRVNDVVEGEWSPITDLNLLWVPSICWWDYVVLTGFDTDSYFDVLLHGLRWKKYVAGMYRNKVLY